MQIVRLSSDLYHRKRVIKRINEVKRIPSFYYVLSHLWGLSENNRHLWYEIGDYVDDESGKPVEPVSMRPEKRDTLLALLKDHPDSYWWIDILCARTDTPLDIMGDIYACCLECISMIDCDPNLIRQLNTVKDLRNLLPAEGKNGITGLNELLLFKQPYDKSLLQLMDLLFMLVHRQWWKRVWTLQEMALPFGEVRLMAETGTHRPLHNTITVDDLLRHFKDLCYFILTYCNRKNVKSRLYDL